MAVLDSSVLIPLAWVGRLDLLYEVFSDLETTDDVQAEVLEPGKRGTAALRTFLDEVSVHESPSRADELAELEGIAAADAGVILLADERDTILLTNDKGLVQVAKSHGIECWWLTTVLLKAVKDGIMSGSEGSDLLYDLVDQGLNLHPKVYAQVQRQLDELDD